MDTHVKEDTRAHNASPMSPIKKIIKKMDKPSGVSDCVRHVSVRHVSHTEDTATTLKFSCFIVPHACERLARNIVI